MGVRIKKHTKRFEKKLARAWERAIQVAGGRLQQLVKAELNTSAGPTTVAVKRQTPGGNKNTRTIYTNPSRPGNPPHKRTGHLQRNIGKTYKRHSATKREGAYAVTRVGWRTNAIYGMYHELGIRGVKRPHLHSTFKKNRKAIGRLMVKTVRRRML